jgi:C4-dicarboxylate transporter DctQ subunit
LRTIFSVYAIFLFAVIARYLWRAVEVVRKGPDLDALDFQEGEA